MFRRVAVEGHSMEPTLRLGDWIIVASLVGAPRVGDIVLARDPEDPAELVLKRVVALGDGTCTLLGDRADDSRDSRGYGPVPLAAVLGRAVFRYGPLARLGFL